MIKLYYNEVAREIDLKHRATRRYAVTNYGRIISFTDDLMDGTFIKGSNIDGYRVIRYKCRRKGKLSDLSIMVHHYVVQFFVPKSDENQTHIIRLDYNKSNNHYSNFKWVDKQEFYKHRQQSPGVIESRRKLSTQNIRSKGHKLTANEVKFIKKRLADPNRTIRMKMLAKQFGISEMQLYRIKRGENWDHIKI